MATICIIIGLHNCMELISHSFKLISYSVLEAGQVKTNFAVEISVGFCKYGTEAQNPNTIHSFKGMWLHGLFMFRMRCQLSHTWRSMDLMLL